MEDIQIPDDPHRRHAANPATKTQPIFFISHKITFVPGTKTNLRDRERPILIWDFSFSISHKSRPNSGKKGYVVYITTSMLIEEKTGLLYMLKLIYY